MQVKPKKKFGKPMLLALTTVAAASVAAGCAKKKSSDSTDSSAGTSSPAATKLVTTSANGTVITNLTSPGALALAGSIQILPGASGSSSSSSSLALLGVTGDFDNAKTAFNIQDPALKMLAMVNNMILPCITASGYADTHILNKGVYLAQTDESFCSDGSGTPSTGKTEIPMVVDSKGTTDSAGNILTLDGDIWFTMPSGDGSQQRIAAAVHLKDNPVLDMEFIVTTLDGSGNAVANVQPEEGRVTLSKDPTDSTSVTLTMIDVNPDPDNSSNDQMAVKIKTDANGAPLSGNLNVSVNEVNKQNGQTNSTIDLVKAAYDDKLFAADDKSSGKTCEDQTNFSYNIYNYGVYNTADHNVVKMNGGFPINFTDPVTKKPAQGYASYYGISTQNFGEILPSGLAVTKPDPTNANNVTNYTIVAGPGRLTKITRVATSLDDLDGLELYYNPPQSQTQYCVTWSKAKGEFDVTGTLSQSGNNGPSCTATASAKVTMAPFHDQVQYAGGNTIVLTDDANGVPQSANILVSQDVTGSQSDIALYCVTNCPNANISAATMTAYAQQQNGNNNGGNQVSITQSATLAAPAAYTYKLSQLQLTDGTNPIGLVAGATWPSSNNGIVISTSYLVDGPTLTAIQKSGVTVCDGNNNNNGSTGAPAAATCVNDPFGGAAVAYQWTTGSSNWSQFQGLKDSNGKIVTFDSPIDMVYTHSKQFDASGSATSPFYGKKIHLSWDGSNLNGVPGAQDPKTGYYVNDFGILQGAPAGSTGQYLIRPIRGDKYMKTLSTTACASLDADSNVPDLPSLTSFDSSIANTSAEPSNTGLPLCFVDGVYQGCQGS